MNWKLAPILLAMCLATAGCSPQPAETAREQATPVTALAEIEGFWLVERFDDFVPHWRNGTPWRQAFVEFTGDAATYAVGCNQSGNPAALGEDAILRDTGDGGRIQTLMGCSPEREARDARFFAFFGTSPKVERLGADRVRIAGKDGELVLVTPETWRRANAPQFAEIGGRWVPQMVTQYQGWGYSGMGLEQPGTLTIARGEIAWTGCGGIAVRGQWSDDARFASAGPVQAECDSANNGGPAIVRLLGEDPAAIRTGEHTIVLTAGDIALSLQSEQSVQNPSPPLPAEDAARVPVAPPPPPAPPAGR